MRRAFGFSMNFQVPHLPEAFPCLSPLNLRRLRGPAVDIRESPWHPLSVPSCPSCSPITRGHCPFRLMPPPPNSDRGLGLQQEGRIECNRSCLGVDPQTFRSQWAPWGPHPRPLRGGVSLLWSFGLTFVSVGPSFSSPMGKSALAGWAALPGSTEGQQGATRWGLAAVERWAVPGVMLA